MLIAALVVLYLALPRFIASMYAAYPKFILDRIETENFKLADDAYVPLYSSINQANAWSESANNWQLLANLQREEYNTQLDRLTDVERKALLKQIEVAITHTLKLSPIDPESWYQLAQIRRAEQRSNEEVIKALEMSILTQPMAPTLFIPRIALMLPFKSVLNESAYALLLAQIRLAWQFKRSDFVALVAEHSEDIAIFNEALINNPEQQQEFEKLLENYFKQHLQAE
jgi:hypothetical protein